MSHSELVTDAQVVTGGALVPEGWVLIEDGLIGAVGASDRRPPPADVKTSAGRAFVLPGFIDIHVHGGGGGSFGPDAGSVRRALEFHLLGGTTSLLAGLSTCPPGALLQSVQQLATTPDEPGTASRLLGVHLEGPFISPARRGAHDPQLIRPPDPGELATLLEAAPGRIRLMTAAPELPGFGDLARVARAAGVVLAAGHTDADGPQLLSAIEAGARTLTHTFNAMRPVLHRAPGPMEAIVDTGVFCELICDGVHVHPTFVRMLRSLVGQDRLVLVTDASRWAGEPDRDYASDTRSVEVRDGAVFLRGTNTLAGSTLTMGEAARRYVRFTGADFVELAAVTATNAARALGEDHRIGRIEPGQKADLVLLDSQVNCLGVMSEGRWARGPGKENRPLAQLAGPVDEDGQFGECDCGTVAGAADDDRQSSRREVEPR
jgi:N-acetylglucosamine-6-phosphate deacetylase